MSFLSLPFGILFIALVLCLLLVRPATARKTLVLVASFVFYAWAGWGFVFVLGTVTVVDYLVARALHKQTAIPRRRVLLAFSVVLNLGLLFFFKYSLFAAEIMAVLLRRPWPHWDAVLPIGISFYTFETLSYVIDVYRGATEPAHSLLDYAVFISFFPRLVAGPIMRARQFLPQMAQGFRLTAQNFASGAQIFGIGLMKKLVVADNLGVFVDHTYVDPDAFTPLTWWAVVAAYSFQIYCDFSAYTDMATGLARILGIELPPNFRLPYTAQSITEFWHRWHITLSTWLRDYLYIPLGGNRGGQLLTYRNLMATMLLGGLWHGAAWHFVIWGGAHGLLLSIEKLFAGGKLDPLPWSRPAAWFRAILCFATVSLAWVLFRAKNMHTAGVIFRKLAFLDTGGILWIYWAAPVFVTAFWLGGFVVSQLPERSWLLEWSSPLLPAFFAFVLLSVLLLMPVTTSPFIYFRF
jgi:alginate O-acetyltransferase complex protein AlgI